MNNFRIFIMRARSQALKDTYWMITCIKVQEYAGSVMAEGRVSRSTHVGREGLQKARGPRSGGNVLHLDGGEFLLMYNLSKPIEFCTLNRWAYCR